MRLILIGIITSVFIITNIYAQRIKIRTIKLDDLHAIRDIQDPQISPEGAWVAYTVQTHDLEQDKRTQDVWMSSWDGKRTLRLTYSKKNEHHPRWSPDGQYIAFLSCSDGEKEIDQVWLLNRDGGEAEKITDFRGDVEDLVWSPDSKQLVLVVKDPKLDLNDAKTGSENKTLKPIVINRYQFKKDKTGYLDHRRSHLYLFDIDVKRADTLTAGGYNESLPAWSRDGSHIAFVSKRGENFDRHDNYDIYLTEATAGAQAKKLTTSEVADCDPDWDSRPAWSPDGKYIASIQGGPPELIWYAVHGLASIPVNGGEPNLLLPAFDRNMEIPEWSEDGKYIYFLLEDNCNVHLAKFHISSGKLERVVTGRLRINKLSTGNNGKIALLLSTPLAPPEIYALEGKNLRQITQHNKDLFSQLKLGSVEEIKLKSKDKTKVYGFMVKPPSFQSGKIYPTILRIHGGPVDQFTNAFSFEWQYFAANGYVVVAANPRGSSGRGEVYAKAIYADWGNKDAQDVLAAVDYVVNEGIADPDRLGIGGWSYGGMLTNYTIAQDTRFKAAVSGSSISNILAGYGTDQYIREYDYELGTPWQNLDIWLNISFPFLKADRIKTPTLFLCGEKDFNVPLLNSEQMYQALRSLGTDTQLVIYPGQYHSIKKPSYMQDRLERYLAWYDKYLKTKEEP